MAEQHTFQVLTKRPQRMAKLLSSAAFEDQAMALRDDLAEVQALVGPARASDPATSHRAAPTELRAGSQRARLLAAFHARGMGTSVQACEWADIDPFRGSPWKRVSELKAAGFIEVAGIRVSDGPDREVYSITDKGRAKLGAMCACDTYKKEPRP